jgi:SAM-dependent methyltransferase
VRGWWPLYRTSVALGLRALKHGNREREAVIRIVIPLDPSRYVELPWALEALAARDGDRVLDLASPKLLAVELAQRGAEVVSVDELAVEVERWQRLAGHVRGVTFEQADGRALPYEDATFDHACSISVLEHIPEPGDEEALRELAWRVRPGGRIVLTMPYADVAREDWVEAPKYVDHGPGEEGKHFFQRWYDDAAIERLLDAVPELVIKQRDTVRLQPNWQPLYSRYFPWLIALGPVYGLLAREKRGAGGDVVRLVLERR